MIMDWLRKHKNVILIIVIAGFVFSMFVGFGLYIGTGAANLDTVAEVNDEKIPYSNFTTFYNQVVNRRRDGGEKMTPDILEQMKQEVMQGLIQESVFFQEAKRYGIRVTDQELAQSLTTIPAFQKDGKFDVQTYAQALQFGLRTSPEKFEETQRRQIAVARLRGFIMQSIKITDKELDFEYDMLKTLDPELAESFATKEDYRSRLREEKGAQILNRWYQQLGNNVKVKINLDQIERRRG